MHTPQFVIVGEGESRLIYRIMWSRIESRHPSGTPCHLEVLTEPLSLKEIHRHPPGEYMPVLIPEEMVSEL